MSIPQAASQSQAAAHVSAHLGGSVITQKHIEPEYRPELSTTAKHQLQEWIRAPITGESVVIN